jgi:hypothetical protein
MLDANETITVTVKAFRVQSRFQMSLSDTSSLAVPHRRVMVNFLFSTTLTLALRLALPFIRR